VDELIATVGLTEQAGQRVRRLSGGQRRRLDVAIGIVGRPELLFLDEPTAGFDPEARREFHDLAHRLADLEEATILLTTHDLDEAEKLADRILILAAGRIIADGSADELSRLMSTQAESGGAATGSGSCTRRTSQPGLSASCSGSTASPSRTWRCGGPAWRRPTWRWSGRPNRVATVPA
jgi:ABC-type multidrug transport system ATPase subunit